MPNPSAVDYHDLSATGALVADFRSRLEGLGDAKTKAWWETYMKHVIPFRGIKMPVLRPIFDAWWQEQVAPLPLAQQVQAAAALFDSPWSEDKLAGVLAFERLAPDLSVDDLAAVEGLFRDELLFDWNNTDWLCVKALHKLALRGLEFADPIARWTALDDAPLWQRRAGAVAFVNLAKHGNQPPSSPQHVKLMWMAATNNVRSPERFMQTSVGWLVRELSIADPESAVEFAQRHRTQLSREALRYIGEKLAAEARGMVIG